MWQPRLVVSPSRAAAHDALVRRGAAVVARAGMRVRARDPGLVRETSGRVCEGGGLVERADDELGNLTVWWDEGDRTVWTRAGADGDFDVCVER
jgi:hypothetical protein